MTSTSILTDAPAGSRQEARLVFFTWRIALLAAVAIEVPLTRICSVHGYLFPLWSHHMST